MSLGYRKQAFYQECGTECTRYEKMYIFKKNLDDKWFLFDNLHPENHLFADASTQNLDRQL